MSDYLYKKLYTFLLQPFFKWYLKKQRLFAAEGIKLKIYPGVFHPGIFFSTSVLSEFIKSLELENKKICDVGAGSGFLSMIAYKKGADVVAIEISQIAVNGIIENFESNFKQEQNFKVFRSNLFDNVALDTFDFVFINPPYFFKSPTTAGSHAWYCGSNGEYFVKLFEQLKNFINTDTQTFMVLAENCEVRKIRSIAFDLGYDMVLILEQKKKWEKNFIFSIKMLGKKTNVNCKDAVAFNIIK